MPEIILILDEFDYETVRTEIDFRNGDEEPGGLPPEGESNAVGAIVAQLVREINEYRDLYERHERTR